MPAASALGTCGPSVGDGWLLAAMLGDVLGRAGSWLIPVDDADASQRDPSAGLISSPAAGYGSAMDSQLHPRQAADRAPRVLLVDDNVGMRRVLRGLLEDEGMEVVGEAIDGLEGVAQAGMLRPDVVLMDLRMPRLDGLAATAQIRSRLPDIQVVMFSSAEGAGMGSAARQAGASAFVAKGASSQQVCAAVMAAWSQLSSPADTPLDSQ
jgi:CheY-like chemotaxis protein